MEGNENANANDNHSHLDLEQNENQSHLDLQQAGQTTGGDPLLHNDQSIKVSQNFSSDISDSDNYKPLRKAGRPPGSPNKKTEVAPYYRRTQSDEDEELLKDIFTVVFKAGLDKEAFVMAAMRIPRYQWLNMVNKPDSKIRETIQMAIDAHEVDMLQRYNQRIDEGGKAGVQYLSEEVKRIRRKHGEADFLLQAGPTVYDKMEVDDLEKLALEHVNKSK